MSLITAILALVLIGSTNKQSIRKGVRKRAEAP
jgi:hypothetical protein